MTNDDQIWLNAPKSTSTVRVRLVDTTSVMLLHSISFIEPVMPGHETMSMTDVAFLIENPKLGKKAMFDLGVRKDYWNLPPKISERLGSIALGLRVDKDVPQILQSKHIPLEDINDIIWSHSHWDHTGDPSLFPSTTTLVYGPGISQARPGYPTNPESPQPETNFSDRPNREISFSSSLTIGGFNAHDFYGDGSFYLLDTPGHSQGHMCGLARTTTDDNGKSTFMLLGGDMCHFCGDLRPSIANPLPKGKLPGTNRTGTELIKHHPRFPPLDPNASEQEIQKRRTTPWYKVSTDKKSAYDGPGPEVAQRTVDNVRERFDDAANVFVALAHDMAMLDVVPTLNEEPEAYLNDWYKSGWKEQAAWGWVRELDQGKALVNGFWKDGANYKTMEDLLKDVGKGASKI